MVGETPEAAPEVEEGGEDGNRQCGRQDHCPHSGGKIPVPIEITVAPAQEATGLSSAPGELCGQKTVRLLTALVML